MKTGAIVQARTASTRLPQKVLKELPYGSGITVLEQVIRRIKRSKRLNEIIVATTGKEEDDEAVVISGGEGIGCFRGSETDVLSRYYHAAKESALDTVVRITSDCPCIDPEVIDFIVSKHAENGTDYTSNTLNRTYPHGIDVEVFSFEALEISFYETREDFEREHVTPYLYRSGKFKTMNIFAPQALTAPDIRVTLDTEEDYALLCAVFDFLYNENHFFGTSDVVDLFGRKPWLKYIVKKVTHKAIFDSLEDELREAAKILERQDLKKASDFVNSWLENQK